MVITHENVSSAVSFSSAWDILGPFQTGTREASWGADPLESIGGFHGLQHNAEAEYSSSLAPNGRVSWSSQRLASLSRGCKMAEATLTVSFPSVDWKFLQSVYGWAALQYQAWARGHLRCESGTVRSMLLYTDNVLEFWLDDQHFFGGDFYTYRKAPLVLHLEPGRHNLDIRLIRDIRVMGGNHDPKISIKLKIEESDARLAIVAESIVVSEVVDGSLASPFASTTIRNDGKVRLQVLKIASESGTVTAAMLEKSPLGLMPGQSRPLKFRISPRGSLPDSVALRVTYVVCGSSETLHSATLYHTFARRDIHRPHKFTFLHPSGIVSYAILRAPSNATRSKKGCKQGFPILLVLHGAGVEAESEQVRHALDAVPDLPAWVLSPAGVTPWSADDWHTWGIADVEAGTAAIVDWIETTGWNGPSVSTRKWLVSGHSNGGQGTWYALTHRPDMVIGAAPVSGYSSIQSYVPYQMWREVDPRVMFWVQYALQSFRHELLIHNFEGIPTLQQHGDADDNVPTYQSRRMSELISQSNNTATAAYSELKGKGHWFDGVMSTPPLRKFYAAILDLQEELPVIPQSFSIVIANPADMGPRGGLVVDQLSDPGQLGHINVSRSTSAWTMTTSNIQRFHFECSSSAVLPMKVIVDQNCLDVSLGEGSCVSWVVRMPSGCWHISHDRDWLLWERHGAQLGPLDSILRSPAPFVIRSLSVEASNIALQVSRNLFQYFSADTDIVDWLDTDPPARGNVISIAMGQNVPPSVRSDFPLDLIENQGLRIRKAGGKTRIYRFQTGLGAIFLRPLSNQRLELVIWGVDSLSLRLAARLLPMLTGVGQPEFSVISDRCAWEGAGGVLAMGSFDSFWNISDTSFIS